MYLVGVSGSNYAFKHGLLSTAIGAHHDSVNMLTINSLILYLQKGQPTFWANDLHMGVLAQNVSCFNPFWYVHWCVFL